MNDQSKKTPAANPQEIPAPSFCCFSLCDSCVLQCMMCQKWKDDLLIKPDVALMKLDDWKQAARSLKTFAPDNLVINFGGGEVTMVPWLFDIVKYCHDLGFVTNIATNGFLIDEAMVGRIADSGLDYINISLDSLDETIHDRLRGVAGVYERVMNAIALISARSPRTQISLCSILMEPTLDGMVELVEWVERNKHVAMIYLMAVMQPNNTAPDTQWYQRDFEHLWPKDYKEVEYVLDQLISRKQRGYRICNPVEHLEAFKTYFYNPELYVKKSSCNINRALHISSVGGVFMCYQHQRLGDARDQDLRALWTGDVAVRVRQDIQACQKNCHFLLNCNFEV